MGGSTVSRRAFAPDLVRVLRVVAFGVAGIAGLVLLAACEPAPCSATWTATGAGDWRVGANWDSGVAPTSSDVVCIPEDADVTVPAGPTAISGLKLGGALRLAPGAELALAHPEIQGGFAARVTIDAGATLTLAGGTGTLTLGGGTLAGEGTLAAGLTSAARIEPGDPSSPEDRGVLTITGSADLTRSTVGVDLASSRTGAGVGFDRLVIGGLASLGSTTVDVDRVPGESVDLAVPVPAIGYGSSTGAPTFVGLGEGTGPNRWLRGRVGPTAVELILVACDPATYHPGADLRGTDQTNRDLRSCDLTGAQLGGATLTNARLAGTDLGGAGLAGVRSGGVVGPPATLPTDWFLSRGYLFGPGADIGGADLTDVVLAHRNLAGIDLGGAVLDDADLRGVDLRGADLRDATFPGADLEDADLTSASMATVANAGASRFRGTDLANADLTGADATDVRFEATNLQRTKLGGANLTRVASRALVGTPDSLPPGWRRASSGSHGVVLVGPTADLSDVSFLAVDLTGADLRGVDLSRADLTGAILRGVDLRDADVDAVLVGADLSGATVAGASFADADLRGAVLTGVDLAGLDLRRADLTDQDLGGRDLAGAVLTGADLTRVIARNVDLTGASLTDAKIDALDLTGANLTDVRAGPIRARSIAPVVTAPWHASPTFLAGPTVDLSHLDLGDTGYSLTGFDLTGADLTGIRGRNLVGGPVLPAPWRLRGGYLLGPTANLNGYVVDQALTLDFRNVDLTGATLAGSTLDRVDLTGATLVGADLSGATLVRPVLTGADLSGANLQGATLSSTTTLTGVRSGSVVGTPAALPARWVLTAGYLVGPGADLTAADLTGRTLGAADLTGAILTDAVLTDANLTNVTLIGATVTGARFGGATFRGVRGSGVMGTPTNLPSSWELRSGFLLGPGANLSGFTVDGVWLGALDLTGANLSGATVRNLQAFGVDLTGANLTGAAFSNVSMNLANLTGADLGPIAVGGSFGTNLTFHPAYPPTMTAPSGWIWPPVGPNVAFTLTRVS